MIGGLGNWKFDLYEGGWDGIAEVGGGIADAGEGD